MTSLERVVTAIEHKQPDRIPIDFRFSIETMNKLMNYLGMNKIEVEEWIGQDVITVRPVYPAAVSTVKYADPTVKIDESGHYIDMYGVHFKRMKSSCQDYLEITDPAPLKGFDTIEQLNEFHWPVTDGWDYSNIEVDLNANAAKATWCRSRGFFATSQMMRGMDTFLIDMAINPNYAMKIAEKVMEFVGDDAEKTLKAGKGNYTFIEYNDDVGVQNAMMISPEMWRQYIKPIVKSFCEMAHKYGAYLKVHSCGSIYPIIPDLIEIGVDILNPIQPLAKNMDPFKLKKEFGKDICLHGGVDIQQLLPFSPPEDVKGHVGKLVDIVGKDGGYIISGSHTLQADAKMENIVALREAIHGR